MPHHQQQPTAPNLLRLSNCPWSGRHEPRQQPGDEGDPVRNGVDEHVFVAGVGTRAAAAQPVEDRNAQCGKKVRVAAAADADRFERGTQFASDLVSQVEQRLALGGEAQGWPAPLPGYSNGDARIGGPEIAEYTVDPVGFGLLGDPDVDEAVGPARDDVARGASLDGADIDRGSGAVRA